MDSEDILNEVKEEVAKEEKSNLPDNPLNLSSVVKQINEEGDIEKIKDLTKLFNVAMMKKEINRAERQSDILDYALEVINEKLLSGEVSDKALGTYVKVLQDNINNVRKMTTEEPITPITYNHQEITINNGDALTKEERDNVIDFIQKVLTQSKSEDIIDIESSNEKENLEKDD